MKVIKGNKNPIPIKGSRIKFTEDNINNEEFCFEIGKIYDLEDFGNNDFVCKLNQAKNISKYIRCYDNEKGWLYNFEIIYN